MIVELADGRTFPVQESNGSYHVLINGEGYCATSYDVLLEGLSKVFRLAYHVYTPPRDPLREAVRTIISANSSLQDRQTAAEDIRNLAHQGNMEAEAIVRLLDNRPPPSRPASQIAKQLGKDFSKVTHEELVKYVNDLVLRSKLLLELSDRVRLS